MSFQKRDQVRATTKIRIGNTAFIPRNMTGVVVQVEGLLAKKYRVRWDMQINGRPIEITVSGQYLQGTFAY